MANVKYNKVDGSSKIKELKESSKKLASSNYYEMLAEMSRNPDKYFLFLGQYGVTVTFLTKTNKAGFHPVMQTSYGNSIEFIYANYVDGKMEKDPADVKLTFKNIGLNAGNVGLDKELNLVKVLREGEHKVKEATGEVCF